MRIKLKTVIGTVSVALLIGLTALPANALGAPAPKQNAAAAPKAVPETLQEKAPDFVLKDLKGQNFRLGDYRGKKPVLVIFSATWCTFCKAEIPHFKKIYETYAKQGLEIANIDIQESKTKVAKFTADNKLPYRVLLDEDGTVAGIYEIPGVPMLFLVDKNGMIVCRQCRNIDALLESLFKKP